MCGALRRTCDDCCIYEAFYVYEGDCGLTSCGSCEGQTTEDYGLPVNDQCVQAMWLNPGDTYYNSVEGTTLGATDDQAHEINGVQCGTSHTVGGVWYVVDGTGGWLRASTCNQADFDTKLTIFSGSCGMLTCEIGLDDNFAAGCAGFTTELDFPTSASYTYYIYVHGWASQQGNFVLTVENIPPPNNQCQEAVPLGRPPSGGLPLQTRGTTLAATHDSAPELDCDGVAHTVGGAWYSFIGPGGLVRVSTCNQADFDTAISVFTDPCSELTCVAARDDNFAAGCMHFTTELDVETNADELYFVYVHGWGSEQGNFQLEVTNIAEVPTYTDRFSTRVFTSPVAITTPPAGPTTSRPGDPSTTDRPSTPLTPRGASSTAPSMSLPTREPPVLPTTDPSEYTAVTVFWLLVDPGSIDDLTRFAGAVETVVVGSVHCDPGNVQRVALTVTATGTMSVRVTFVDGFGFDARTLVDLLDAAVAAGLVVEYQSSVVDTAISAVASSAEPMPDKDASGDDSSGEKLLGTATGQALLAVVVVLAVVAICVVAALFFQTRRQPARVADRPPTIVNPIYQPNNHNDTSDGYIKVAS